MFLFNNKSNAVPRSRRSSIDSLVTNSLAPTSTTTSDAWVSQSSDVSSSAEMPSSEQHERHQLGKRSSVFKLRSRSNTATSTASSFMSISSAMVRVESARSPDSRQFPGQNLLDFSGSKRPLFARGKRGKRRSGQLSPSAQFDDDGEVDESSRRTSVLRKGKKAADQSENSPSSLKLRISSPFDFQHVAHTDRHHVNPLDRKPEEDGMVEHSAGSTSQGSRHALKGIKAEDLHFDNFSSDSLVASESRSTSVLGFRSPAMSPAFSPEHDATSATLRTARSVESFSQPGILPRVHRHTQSATPSSHAPPARSFSPIDDALEIDFSSRRVVASPRSNRSSGVWDKFVPLVSPLLDNKLPTIADEADNFGHAITTPDDSAIHAMTPIYSPGLEDVAEEPERFSSPRPAPSPPIRSPRSPRSAFFDSLPTRSTQRTPISRSNSRSGSSTSSKPSQRAPITRPISQMSDTLGSPIPARRNSVRRSSTTRRKSNTWRVIEESWEDDVDFIYENALEAACDFDWENGSDSGRTPDDRERTPQQQDGEQPTNASSHSRTVSMGSEGESIYDSSFYPGSFRPSLLVPSTTSIPELESRSALSASTADTSVHTPSDLFVSIDRRQATYTESEGFILTPSMLVPPEYKDQPRDEMYNDLLADYEGSDRHFPILDARKSISSSCRSSHVRSSKRSSYDSSLMSSVQGSGIWGTPVRRSASSSGSLPELVHSRRSRKDFNVAVEQLSEKVAAVTTSGNHLTKTEDDDVTPPGRQFQDRTFFASEDEEETQAPQSAIESEVRASLELARQGSTRPSGAQHHGHKYASSDGAAKLLASPMMRTPELQQPPKGRARAASSAARTPRPYLSLFPTPPKTTPLATPTSPNPPKKF